MNKKEKKYYIELLNREKERIFKNLGYLREGIESGEKGIPTHIADYGTDEFEKGLGIDISDEERKILENINLAIEKIEKNIYGICEKCGKKIAISRLKAIPYARYCIKCQREKEKGGV
ncbi:MAG: TraR/DksA family transcriptional regulator [bacterium]|nr:TraR/DksA family transcriptional regulator [bacterium]